MAVFARVLEATRANLEVMSRLRELREGQRTTVAALNQFGPRDLGADGERPWEPLARAFSLISGALDADQSA